MTEDAHIKELQRNGEIRDKEIRLIGADGAQLGIVSGYEAQRAADEAGLDLVKISPTANPPVCKIMDYGKYRYDQLKKEKEARKNSQVYEVKEIRLSMTIEDNDINIKAKNAAKFLSEGHKVKVSLRMRGRQQAFVSKAVDVVKEFAAKLQDISVVEKAPNTEGRNVIMFLAPQQNKTK